MNYSQLLKQPTDKLTQIIVTDPDPRLRKISETVSTEEISQDLKALAKLLGKLTQFERDGVRTVGMSAVQIGVHKRLATCVNPASKKTYVMINPVIISTSRKESGYWEACASVGVGDNQLFAKVYRPDRTTVEYTNLEGQVLRKKVNGFFSHVVQHEIDHMNGILFIDRVRPEKIWKHGDLKVYLKKEGKYPPA